jgi:hydroxymethylbilane synthase
LIRLGMRDRIQQEINADISLPAVGQGAVGIECRNDDAELIALLASLNHGATAIRVTAERAMNARLEGGCQVPIGSYAVINGNSLLLRGLVGTPDGKTMLKSQAQGPLNDAKKIGEAVASELLAKGARSILDSLYND